MGEYLKSKEARYEYECSSETTVICHEPKQVEYLVNFHEARGDKFIAFSDLVYSLKLYADMLKKTLI